MMTFLVLGLGVSGRAAVNLAHAKGLFVQTYDDYQPAKWNPCNRDQIDWNIFSHCVVSPGVSLDHPLLKVAKEQGLSLISELELAIKYLPERTKLIAITGTNGKTTTGFLLKHIFQEASFPVEFLGNMGVALSDRVLDLLPGSYVILECSSYQLELLFSMKARVAIILNVSCDHMDRHSSIESYQNLKMRVFQNQTQEDLTVMSSMLLREQNTVPGKGRRMYFDQYESSEWFQSMIVGKGLSLKGSHNEDNILAASLVALDLGVSEETLIQAVISFSPLSHRLEWVRELNHIQFINDSKATNEDAVCKALQSFKKPPLLLFGGRLKSEHYEELEKILKESVKCVVLFGEARIVLEERWASLCSVWLAATLDEAIMVALTKAGFGDDILLSPGCSSFDAYENFEERGKHFKEVVMAL
jgi:UDP-N-acetylmuramoylalanine--D-glutamate ligase